MKFLGNYMFKFFALFLVFVVWHYFWDIKNYFFKENQTQIAELPFKTQIKTLPKPQKSGNLFLDSLGEINKFMGLAEDFKLELSELKKIQEIVSNGLLNCKAKKVALKSGSTKLPISSLEVFLVCPEKEKEIIFLNSPYFEKLPKSAFGENTGLKIAGFPLYKFTVDAQVGFQIFLKNIFLIKNLILI